MKTWGIAEMIILGATGRFSRDDQHYSFLMY
jgi:hypothetical protein